MRAQIPVGWTVYFYLHQWDSPESHTRVLTFIAAVDVLADSSCLAAPAFAFVVILGEIQI